MFKLTIKNNFLNLFLLLSLLLIIIFVYIFNCNSKISIKEPLQNFDASYVSYDEFSGKIKNSEDEDLSGILTTQFYTANDFNSGAKHYKDSEIEKDIKYFNNVTHIMIGYIRKNMLPESYNVQELDDIDE